VFLDLDRDGRLDSGEPWMRSDSRGRYRFDNLPPTTYSIRVTPVESWRPRPDWHRTVTLSPGALLGANFYLTPSITIRGRVFADLNRNGRFDDGDAFEHMPVYIDLDYDGEHDWQNEPSVSIYEFGQPFAFTGLRRGTYRVRTLAEQFYEVVPPGYRLVNALTPAVYEDVYVGIIRM
jgi:hypothetical protein